MWPEVKDGQVGVSPARQAPLVRHPGRDRLRAVPTAWRSRRKPDVPWEGARRGGRQSLLSPRLHELRFVSGRASAFPLSTDFIKKKKMCVWHKVNPEGRLEGWPLRPGLQTPSLWVTASAACAPQPGTGSGERGGLAGEGCPAAASPRGGVLPRVGCTEPCGLGLWGREGWSLCRHHGSLVSARCACPCLSPRPP